jgi:hypothetical protein
MTAGELLVEARRRGVLLAADGDALAVEGDAAALDDGFLDGLRDRKADLLALLVEGENAAIGTSACKVLSVMADTSERMAADWAWYAREIALDRRVLLGAAGTPDAIADVDGTAPLPNAAGVMSTAGPCRWCGCALSWRSVEGATLCRNCKPPVAAELVEARLVAVQIGGRWEWENIKP